MRAAAIDTYGEADADKIFSPDTRELMAFFITMRKLLLECGIKDFTFSDLYRPTRERLVKIFSYIINFIRFRESQTSVIDEHYNSSERTKNSIEQLYNENQEKTEQLAEMQRNRQNIEKAIREKEARNEELKRKLLELQKMSTGLQEKTELIKKEQTRMRALAEERITGVMNMRAEADKLRPYAEQSPAKLEQTLRDLNAAVTSDKNEIDRLDRRSRALQTSYESFGVVLSDINQLTKTLSDLQTELSKEEEEQRKASSHREALAGKSNEVREVERQEKMLRKQLEQWQSRTEKIKRDADKRTADAKTRMDELREEHREVVEKRKESGNEVERRKVRIEMVEKKVSPTMHEVIEM